MTPKVKAILDEIKALPRMVLPDGELIPCTDPDPYFGLVASLDLRRLLIKLEEALQPLTDGDVADAAKLCEQFAQLETNKSAIFSFEPHAKNAALLNHAANILYRVAGPSVPPEFKFLDLGVPVYEYAARILEDDATALEELVDAAKEGGFEYLDCDDGQSDVTVQEGERCVAAYRLGAKALRGEQALPNESFEVIMCWNAYKRAYETGTELERGRAWDLMNKAVKKIKKGDAPTETGAPYTGGRS